jgi:hypothetical protein
MRETPVECRGFALRAAGSVCQKLRTFVPGLCKKDHSVAAQNIAICFKMTTSRSGLEVACIYRRMKS